MRSEDDIKPFLQAFGQRIKDLRNREKMTQLDLASSTDMDTRQIQRIEAGKVNTSVGNAYAIATALGVSVPTLFEFEVG